MVASQEQINALLNHCIDFAGRMLADHAEFYPFGATLDNQGSIEAAGAHTGDEFPEPQEIIDLMTEAFARQAAQGAITAAAIAVDVNIPSSYNASVPDGIRILLESPDLSVLVYVPYAVAGGGADADQNDVTLFETIEVSAAHSIFKMASNA